MNQAEQVKVSILEIEDALLSSNPMLPQLLRKIHTNLRNDPEVVTLLSDEDIGILVRGQMKQMNTAIAEKLVKAKATGAKALKNLDISDL